MPEAGCNVCVSIHILLAVSGSREADTIEGIRMIFFVEESSDEKFD